MNKSSQPLGMTQRKGKETPLTNKYYTSNHHWPPPPPPPDPPPHEKPKNLWVHNSLIQNTTTSVLSYTSKNFLVNAKISEVFWSVAKDWGSDVLNERVMMTRPQWSYKVLRKHMSYGVVFFFRRQKKHQNIIEGEVHDFYKTSWFVEFEALSRMVKVRGSCNKPFKRYSRLKNLLCERPHGTNSWRHWAIQELSKCADSSHFTFFHFVLIVMHLHFGVALDILAGEKQAAKVNLGQQLSLGSSARAYYSSMTSRGCIEVWPGRVTCTAPALWSISITNITWTASRTNLGPSPFDSAPRTLQTMKFCKNRELPL